MNFNITKRHYDIIIKHMQDAYPYEGGGFVGGKDFLISAIFPVFNKDISNKTDIFSITNDDIERAHLFFNKHGLEYYGTYHSHPKGEAIPSEQDLKNIQKYLFIISLRNFDHPDFAAYQVTGIQQAKRVPLNILSDSNFSVKDIKEGGSSGTSKNNDRNSLEVPFFMPDYNDHDKLNEKLHRVLEQESTYEKKDRSDGLGDFSTLA